MASSWIVPVSALTGTVLTIVGSGAASWLLARRAAREAIAADQIKRQSELALKISQLVSDNPAAARRFAVAVLKVITDGAEKGKVHFIPANSRITVGRDPENDIVIPDHGRTTSRFHCGFVSQQETVFVEDYRSTNGTLVNGEQVRSMQLVDGDRIKVGPLVLQFQFVVQNKLLCQ